MCGIAGLVDLDAATPHEGLRAGVQAMSDRQVHRGPDSDGAWIDADAGVALGFRRLAILDLSPSGNQPMTSPSRRWVVVFNGEIYNHRELRSELAGAGVQFAGTSDSEVLVAAIDRWGFDDALARANGMFALGAWDRAERRLLLARDRFGEKPLYYGWAGRTFAFASELGAIRCLPGFDATVDPDALAGYLSLTHVPAPRTIHRGARTLGAGQVLELDPAVAVAGTWTRARTWWSPSSVIDRAHAEPFDGDERAGEQAISELLLDAVRVRLDSDVPLGCFLSGGVDSSLVTALAAASVTGSVRSFTVRMPELGFDESREAAAVAAHLGTDHEVVDLSVAEALAAVPKLPAIYGEPFGDPSALPSTLVCGAARRHVKVALGGDGGDELFVGYNRYVLGDRLWRRLHRLPAGARRATAVALGLVSPSTIDRWAPARLGLRNPGDKVQKLVRLLRVDGQAAFADALVEEWAPEEILRGWRPTESPSTREQGTPTRGLVDELVRRDLETTLPDQMLVKLDRASMAVGLEARSPLLDHRLLALVGSMPLTWHLDSTGGKRMLRAALIERVPSHLVDRPKMGFDPPIGSWLRGPLRSWAADLLAPADVRAAGLRFDVVDRCWQQHLAGRQNHDYRLWTVLQYLAWRDAV